MNAVICMLNSKYIHSSLAPWYLLAGVKCWCGDGIKAEVFEGTINMDSAAIIAQIVKRKPMAIGFCAYIWNITMIKKILPIIKHALPDSVIILGGPEVSYNAGDVLRDVPSVDYIISGEGEEPFALLLNALAKGQPAEPIAGVCYRHEGQSIVVPPNMPRNEPPNPYGGEYLASLSGRIAYLETSRGCPFSCAFCLSGRGSGIRYFDLNRAKSDLLLLAKSGTQTVKFVDRTFNADRGRAREIYRFIIDNIGHTIPQNVRFHFEIAGDLLDEETIDILKAAPKGVLQFEIGLQSFNPATLNAISRQTNIETLINNIEQLVALGNIHIHIDLIAGLPHEDRVTFAESFNTAYALRPHMLQLGFLKILHGAPMREKPEEFPCQFSSQAPYEVTETPWITNRELERVHHAEDALERLYNSGRFSRTLDYVLGLSGLTPFELFAGVGEHTADKVQGISLDDYIALIKEYLGSLHEVDATVLRDQMVSDYLETNSTGRLPLALFIRDSRFKSIAAYLNSTKETKQLPGVKRGHAVLYSENVVAFADYIDKDEVRGEYTLRKVPLP